MPNFTHADITGAIINAFYTVYRTHRRGHREREFAHALAVELRHRGHHVRTEYPVYRRYQGRPVGTGKVDLVVDGLVAVEVKNVQRLTRKHERQLRAYLADGGWPIGLLLNYGASPPQIRRLEKRDHELGREQ